MFATRLLFFVLVAAPLEAAERQWVDSTGKYRVDAAMVRREGDAVVLRKRDGATVTVPIKRLSAADQEYLRRSGQEASPSASAGPASASRGRSADAAGGLRKRAAAGQGGVPAASAPAASPGPVADVVPGAAPSVASPADPALERGAAPPQQMALSGGVSTVPAPPVPTAAGAGSSGPGVSAASAREGRDVAGVPAAEVTSDAAPTDAPPANSVHSDDATASPVPPTSVSSQTPAASAATVPPEAATVPPEAATVPPEAAADGQAPNPASEFQAKWGTPEIVRVTVVVVLALAAFGLVPTLLLGTVAGAIGAGVCHYYRVPLPAALVVSLIATYCLPFVLLLLAKKPAAIVGTALLLGLPVLLASHHVAGTTWLWSGVDAAIAGWLFPFGMGGLATRLRGTRPAAAVPTQVRRSSLRSGSGFASSSYGGYSGYSDAPQSCSRSELRT